MTMTMTKKGLMVAMGVYETELKSRLTPDEFSEVAKRAAVEAFKSDINDLPEGDLKQYCLENFDRIVSDREELTQ